MSADDFRRASLTNWQTIARGWERRRAELDEIAAPVREWLVRSLAPQEGETILELAAGPGDTGFSAAALLGEDGRLITSDFAPAMIEVARRRAAELGLDNVEFRVLDAHELELDDDSVDGVICCFGFMLMADPAAALAETRRVLRPGGRLVFAVWRAADQNPWVSLSARVLVDRGLTAPTEAGSPGAFALASDDRVQAVLDGAGFRDVRIDDVPVRHMYADIDEYVAAARQTMGAFATAFDGASEEQQRAVIDELHVAFAPFATADGIELPGLALVAVAS